MAVERILGELTLVTDESDAVVTVSWLGKSTASAPGDLIGPVLLGAADRAQATQKRLVFAFERLDFFNSATITVLLRTVRALRSRRARRHVRLGLPSPSLLFEL